MKEPLPLRPAAGIMLLNREGKVWVGQRLDSSLEAWQMPQGGLDPGEDPLEGALRELQEETGIPAADVELIAQAPEVLEYELPPELTGKVWGGKYRGQAQHWFLFRYLGEDHRIDIRTPEPEFRAWRWSDPADLPVLVVGFKRHVYNRLLELFGEHLG